MRVMNHNDEIIRRVKTFKNYNMRSSEILSEDFDEVSSRQLEKPLFCGVFTAKIYIGNQVMGTYRFDCRHFRNFMDYDYLTPKLTKLK